MNPLLTARLRDLKCTAVVVSPDPETSVEGVSAIISEVVTVGRKCAVFSFRPDILDALTTAPGRHYWSLYHDSTSAFATNFNEDESQVDTVVIVGEAQEDQQERALLTLNCAPATVIWVRLSEVK